MTTPNVRLEILIYKLDTADETQYNVTYNACTINCSFNGGIYFADCALFSRASTGLWGRRL